MSQILPREHNNAPQKNSNDKLQLKGNAGENLKREKNQVDKKT